MKKKGQPDKSRKKEYSKQASGRSERQAEEAKTEPPSFGFQGALHGGFCPEPDAECGKESRGGIISYGTQTVKQTRCRSRAPLMRKPAQNRTPHCADQSPSLDMLRTGERLLHLRASFFARKNADEPFGSSALSFGFSWNHLATSVTRDSRITLTLIWPGYSISSSIFFEISLARRTMSSSLTCSGTTMTRTSRPA